jgi:hypothetical protein
MQQQKKKNLYCAACSTLIGAAAYLHFCAGRTRAFCLLTVPRLAPRLAAIWLAALIPLVQSICSTCDATCRLHLMLEGCVRCLSCLCLFGLRNCPRQKPQSSLASVAFLCNNRYAPWATMYTLKAWHLQLCLLLQCCCMYNDKSGANDSCTAATEFELRAAANNVQ